MGREYALAKAAFAGCKFRKAHESVQAPGRTITEDQTLCDVGPLVSRKAQFVPAFAKVLNAGFKCHKQPTSSPNYVKAEEDELMRDVVITQEGRENSCGYNAEQEVVRNESAA